LYSALNFLFNSNELPNIFCEINIHRVKSGIAIEDVTKHVFPAPTPGDPHARSRIADATLFDNMAQKTDISTSMYFVYPLIVIPDNGTFRIDATVRDRRMHGIPPLPNSEVVPDGTVFFSFWRGGGVKLMETNLWLIY
jgi:hypothetical protein